MNLALLGFAMVISFMTLIMTKRLPAVTALVVIPIIFGLIAGGGPKLGGMIVDGVKQIAPTAVMLTFAVLYFGIMIDAGLFDPLVRRVVAIVGSDPVRITVGTAILATIISLDGDGTTTALVTLSAMLPIYRRLKMNPLILGTLLLLCSTLMHLNPWGGPMARAAAALQLDLATVSRPLLPSMLVGLLGTFVLAYGFGRTERKRLAGPATAAPNPPDAAPSLPLDLPERRPKLFWFNVALTVALVAGMALGLAPLPALTMSAFAIGITINYPNPKIQRERLATHAENVVGIVLLLFAAGAFTGILKGTGMVEAMASSFLQIIPPALGPYLAPITALASMPLTFVMSNDAYYFGVLPVIAKTATSFGIPPEAIARASLMGLCVHGLSPLLAPVYLVCGLLKVDVADAQRFSLKWAILISLLVIAAAILTGAFPLHA
jgi:citrate-Mg2+:H+ or citrate-Ca2+:H+ symporter, CitMHS family